MREKNRVIKLTSIVLIAIAFTVFIGCGSDNNNNPKLTYSVNFSTNGGSSVPARNVPQQGGVIETSPVTTRAGYDFEGWYSDSLLTNRVSFPYVVTGNTTLYAKWTPQVTQSAGFIAIYNYTGYDNDPIAGIAVYNSSNQKVNEHNQNVNFDSLFRFNNMPAGSYRVEIEDTYLSPAFVSTSFSVSATSGVYIIYTGDGLIVVGGVPASDVQGIYESYESINLGGAGSGVNYYNLFITSNGNYFVEWIPFSPLYPDQFMPLESGTYSISGNSINFEPVYFWDAFGDLYTAGPGDEYAGIYNSSTRMLTVHGLSFDKLSVNDVNNWFNNDSGGTDILNGTWSRSNGKYSFTISGNNWVYSENGEEYSKGTLNTATIPTAPYTGTITLTVTNVKSGSYWEDLPSQYSSVKTNTASLTINAAGNQMTISGAVFTTNGVWGTLEGTYTKLTG